MICYGNLIWEGLSTETKPTANSFDGQTFKELDTGNVFYKILGQWTNVHTGESFIAATKSGKITTDSQGNYNVSFNTPFADNNYIVTLTVMYGTWGGALGAIAYKDNLTTTGFTIRCRSLQKDPLPNVVVSWLATKIFNP